MKMVVVWVVCLSVMHGCTVTAGFHVDKAWQTDGMYTNPDHNTRFKIETSKTFHKRGSDATSR